MAVAPPHMAKSDPKKERRRTSDIFPCLYQRSESLLDTTTAWPCAEHLTFLGALGPMLEVPS